MDGRISEENRLTLLEQAKSYKKLDSLSLACEEYKLKDYISNQNLADARLTFRTGRLFFKKRKATLGG